MKRRHKPEARKSARAKLAGSVPVMLRLDHGRRVQGKLHELSATGGMIHLKEPLDAGSAVMLVFVTRAGMVKETAEMLASQWATQGCLQPFRFTGLGDGSRRRLHSTLRELLGRTV